MGVETRQPLAALVETLAQIEEEVGRVVCDLQVGPFFKPVFPHQREAASRFYRSAMEGGHTVEIVDNGMVLSVFVRIKRPLREVGHG